MSAPELTVFVSGAGAILAATIEAGAELSAVQQEMAAILRRLGLGRDYLQPENHNLAKLRALVEERLIVNKGQGLIEEHTSFLNSIVERKRRAIEEQIAEHAEGQDLAGQDKEELSANRQRIQGQVKEINGLSEELKGDLSEMAQDAGQSLKGEVARIKASVIRCVEGKIGAITNTSNFRHQTLWALQECFEKEEGGLYSELREIRASIAERIESRMGKFGAKIAELDIFSRERVQVLLQVKAYDGLEVVRRHFHELLTVEAVGGLVEEVTYFWQRWFDTESGLEKVRLRIMRAVWEALDGQLSRLGESMVDMLNTSLSKLAEESRASLNEAMETRRREIESLLKGEAEREELIAHHAAATAALEAARGELEQLSESLNQTMGV